MTDNAVPLLKARFDALSQRIPDEDIEFWVARDLMELPGYSRWENFQSVIERAMESCKTTGYSPGDHFRSVTKMVATPAGDRHAKN